MPESLKLEELPENLKRCCEAILDKKAIATTVIDVREISSVTDYYVIASGASGPQLKAMANSAREVIKGMDADVGVIDGDPASGWVVMDAYDFVLHLFLDETRELYAIESLWKDRSTYLYPSEGLPVS